LFAVKTNHFSFLQYIFYIAGHLIMMMTMVLYRP